MEIRWHVPRQNTASAGLGSKHVILNAAAVIHEPAPADSAHRDDRIVFLGPDQDGTILEVMAVETEDGVLVIHAMAIRRKYLDYLEGATDDQA